MMKIILAILLGGLLAGAGDIIYACVHYNLVYGTPPQRILQSVAAGVMGTEASRAGGWTSAGIGLGAHFVLTTMMAAAFVLASLYASLLRCWWWIAGPVYGAGLMFVMNFIVVPMSAARLPPRLPDGQFLYGAIFAHTILVGLVIALTARLALGAGESQVVSSNGPRRQRSARAWWLAVLVLLYAACRQDAVTQVGENLSKFCHVGDEGFGAAGKDELIFDFAQGVVPGAHLDAEIDPILLDRAVAIIRPYPLLVPEAEWFDSMQRVLWTTDSVEFSASRFGDHDLAQINSSWSVVTTGAGHWRIRTSSVVTREAGLLLFFYREESADRVAGDLIASGTWVLCDKKGDSRFFEPKK